MTEKKTMMFRKDVHQDKQISEHKPYKILIVDDERDVHDVTELILKRFRFEHAALEFYHAYNSIEAREIMKEHRDMAVAFLDVVMETDQAGLELVRFIREELRNNIVRIVLRTGEPGQAPEERVIYDYDINDYRIKTEFTDIRLKMTMVTALRGYRDLIKIESHKQGLEKIISASSELFKNYSLDEFFMTILLQLGSFYDSDGDIAYMEQHKMDFDGLMTFGQDEIPLIVAGTGKFQPYIGQPINAVIGLENIENALATVNEDGYVKTMDNGYLIYQTRQKAMNNYIYIEGENLHLNVELVELFMNNYTVAVQNYLLRNNIDQLQMQVIKTFASTIEQHFEEVGSHIERTSTMMRRLCLACELPEAECSQVEIACTLHDIGKIAIPDAVLKKPGRLTAEEFEIIKTHAQKGYDILKGSDLKIMRIAAEIAYSHHEKFDGTGYPQGLVGEQIPMLARLMAIVDVYDAMVTKRVYKEAIALEDTMAYFTEQKGQHFDPRLVDVFIDNYQMIMQGL